jgi:c-di-GMP-binding flagellar brake protein YcgR
MYIDHIKAGDRVDIHMGLKSTVDWSDAYVSRVEAVVGKNKVVIYAPMHLGQEVRLAVNAACTVRFSSKRGYIRFRARVTEHIREENILFIVLRLSGEGSRTQQRNFFRYECAMAVKFYIYNENEKPANGEPPDTKPADDKLHDGIVLDISGGGIRLATRPVMAEGVLLRIILPLNPDQEPLLAFGNVRDRQEKTQAVYPNQYHVQFTALSKIEQERIIQFIYNQQRKSLQRR